MYVSRTKFYRLLLVGVILILAAALAACASTTPPTAQQEAKSTTPPPATAEPQAAQPAASPPVREKLIIAIPAKSLTFLPQYIAAEKGFYAAEGLAAEIVSMKADVTIAGLVAGEVDFSAASGSVVRSAVTGAPVKLLMFTVKELLFSFYSNPGITSIAQLKGKTIGGDAPASTNTITAKDILKSSGLDPDKDVNFVMLASTPNQFAALTSNSIDATILSPPFDAKAEQMGYRKMAWAADLMPGRPFAGMGTGDKTLNEKRDKSKRVLRATLNGINYILKNPAETKAFMAHEFKLTPEEADFVYKQISPALSPTGVASEEGLQVLIDEARTTAGITATIPLSQVADFSLLEELRREMGLK